MRRLMLPLLLALPASAFSGPTAEGAPAPSPVTIYTQFAHPPSAVSVEHMKAELDAIMAPLDLHFAWRSLEQANGHEALFEIVVVSFQGTCRSDGLLPEELPVRALGWTHIADGQVLPFSEVDCDRIRGLMNSPLAAAAPGERARLLGRAMARVLAHELYHFFTNTTNHAHSGIAKACYTGAELAGEQLRFEDAQLRKVRSGRLRELLSDIHRADEPAGGL
jgi:hypothetical protein